MKNNCIYCLDTNFFNGNELNVFYYHGKMDYKDIINRDNKLVRRALRNTFLTSLYEIVHDRGFNITNGCYNFKALFDLNLIDIDNERNKRFFNDNSYRFNHEV